MYRLCCMLSHPGEHLQPYTMPGFACVARLWLDYKWSSSSCGSHDALTNVGISIRKTSTHVQQ